MDNSNTRWRRISAEITAVQWFPDRTVKGVHWESRSSDDGEELVPYVITAHEQRAYLAPGDWVIPEKAEDRYYPCKPDIFAATYEAAVEADADPRKPGNDEATWHGADNVARGPWGTEAQPIEMPQHIAEKLAMMAAGVDDDGDSLPERRRAAALGLAVQVSEESAPHPVTDRVILDRARAFEAYLRGDEPEAQA